MNFKKWRNSKMKIILSLTQNENCQKQNRFKMKINFRSGVLRENFLSSNFFKWVIRQVSKSFNKYPSLKVER